MIKLSIIIPVWSEEDSLREVVEGLYERMPGVIHQVFLICSPKSSDSSMNICRSLTREFSEVTVQIQTINPGLGWAYRQVFPYVTGTHVMVVDADNEMELDTAPKMIEAASKGYDLVLPCRWMPGGGVSGYDPLTYVLNRGFQYIFRLIFWTPCRDLTYGYTLFASRLINEVEWWGQMHEIAMETTLKPLSLGYKWIEIPSKWKKRTQGVSKINTWKRWRYVSFALRIRFVDFRRTPSSEHLPIEVST